MLNTNKFPAFYICGWKAMEKDEHSYKRVDIRIKKIK